MTTISIHAPRTGSDRTPGTGGHHEAISIHAPRTGSDTCAYSQVYSSSDFNPRSPHGERRQSRHAFGEALHFNPRSPHGERRAREDMAQRALDISIHAPRTGSDPRPQRTNPHRGISIHAPRTGSDRKKEEENHDSSNFNPRSPHGERRTPSAAGFSGWGYFNPRSPHGERRATRYGALRDTVFQLSLIHI